MRTLHIRHLLLAVLILALGPLAFSQVCETSVPLGICGPYLYPQVSGSDGNNVNVQNDLWNSSVPAGSSQTMYSFSPGNWYVDATFPTGNTAIESYPDSDAIYLSAPPVLSSFNYMYSSFAEDMNSNANTSAEAAYDIWFNYWANEVMIWTDITNRSTAGCRSLANAQSFGGTNGVPKHLWDLWKCGGSELIWELNQGSLNLCNDKGVHQGGPGLPGFPHESVDAGTPTVYGISKGSVDVLSMLTWLQSNGFLPTDSTLDQVEFGFEIASTGGVSERFQVTGWSIYEDPGLPQ